MDDDSSYDATYRGHGNEYVDSRQPNHQPASGTVSQPQPIQLVGHQTAQIGAPRNGRGHTPLANNSIQRSMPAHGQQLLQQQQQQQQQHNNLNHHHGRRGKAQHVSHPRSFAPILSGQLDGVAAKVAKN